MFDVNKRKTIDLLIEQFWKQGYLTVSRRFGTYLPEPAKVGNFDVDIIAKHKRNYAIGITLTEEDFKDPGILEKIMYLASRQTKFSGKLVLLYIGVSTKFYKNAKALLDSIEPGIRKNIRLVQISERPAVQRANLRDRREMFFS